MTEVRCSVASTAELPPWRALALAVAVHGLGAALLYGASATPTLPALPAPGLTLTLVSLPPAPAAPAAATPPQFAHKQPAPPTRSPHRNDAAVVHHVVHQPRPAPADARPKPIEMAPMVSASSAPAADSAPVADSEAAAAKTTTVADVARPERPAEASAAATEVFMPARAHAAYLHNPEPVYPPLAQRRGQEGTVRVEVRVSPQGLPLAVSLQRSSGVPALDRAALAAVRQWRFVPAKRGVLNVEDRVIVPVEFRLRGGST